MMHRLRHRLPLPSGTQITLSHTTYIIQKLLDCGGSSLLYQVQPVQPHGLPLILKEYYPALGYLRQEDGQICPTDNTNARLLTQWHQDLQEQETQLSQLAARHNFQVIPIREQVNHAVIALPDQPGRVISNFYALMDDRSAQGVVLSACAPDPLPLRQAVLILKTVLSAYAVLHRDRFLHGDCSMGNIMLLGRDAARAAPGTAHLLDFGCARRLMEDGFTAPITGPVYSTDGYCAPELLYALSGSRLTAACDVWSLGFLFLELLTKISREVDKESITEHLIRSFRARQITGTKAKQLHCDAASLHCVNAILERALDENPARRYPNAGAMLEDVLSLERCLCFDHSGTVDRWLIWHAALRFRQREPDRFLTGHIPMEPDARPITLSMQARLEQGSPEPALPLLKRLLRQGGAIYLHAPGGGGKSVLAAQLMAEALSSGEWVPLYLELSLLNQCADPASCRQHILNLLAVQYFGSSETRIAEQIAQFMDMPCRTPGCLLVLNDLHKLSPSLQTVLSELMDSSALGQNTVVLATGRADAFPPLRGVELAPLAHRQICEILSDIVFDSEEFLPLHELLPLPLFLMRYLELIKGSSVGIPSVTTPAQLLLLYFGQREYHAHDSAIHQTLTVHLPFAAYRWMCSNQWEVSAAQIGDWLKEQMGWMYTPERLEEFLRHCTGPLCVLCPAGTDMFRFSHDYNRDYFAASFIAQQLQQALSRQDTYPLRLINHPWINSEHEEETDFFLRSSHHFTYLTASMAIELCSMRLDHGAIQHLCDQTQVFTALYPLLSNPPSAKTDAYYIPYTLYHTFTCEVYHSLASKLFQSALTHKTKKRPSDTVMQPFLELAGQWGHIRAQLELTRLYWHNGDWDTSTLWCRRLLDTHGSQLPEGLPFHERAWFHDIYRKMAIGYWFGLGGLTPDHTLAEHWLTQYGPHDPEELFRTGQYFEFHEVEDGAFAARVRELEGRITAPYDYKDIFLFQEPSRADFAALCYRIAQTCNSVDFQLDRLHKKYHSDPSTLSFLASSIISASKRILKEWEAQVQKNRRAACAITKGDLLWQMGDAPAALGQYRLAYRTDAGQTRLSAIRRLIRRNEELGYTCEAERWREEITPSEEDQEVFECYL